ncbi:MAG: hypothetical protein SPL06_06935 [Bacteroidales bacterium]|nr:hypothetical protein [Bacteroidales bacterium]MDY6424474.1 hypothetical protein [Bacteroidales bacterium]
MLQRFGLAIIIFLLFISVGGICGTFHYKALYYGVIADNVKKTEQVKQLTVNNENLKTTIEIQNDRIDVLGKTTEEYQNKLSELNQKTESLSKELENKEYTVIIPEDIKTCEDKMQYFRSIAKDLGK